MDYYMTPGEVSSIMKIGYRTLIRWIESGEFGEVLRTPTRRYRLTWGNVEYFCKSRDYPLPDKIPAPKKMEAKEIDLIPVKSKKAQALIHG